MKFLNNIRSLFLKFINSFKIIKIVKMAGEQKLIFTTIKLYFKIYLFFL